MNFVRCLSALLSLIVLAGCNTPQPEPVKPVDVGPPIAAPVAMDGAMLTLTVSDLHGFLDEVGEVVAQVSPMMGGAVMKTMLGARLGDPQLAGFAPSNGLAVVVAGPELSFAVAEVQAAYAETYLQAVQAMGLAAKQHDGLLVVAKTEEQLAAAEPLASAAQMQLLEGNRSPALRFATRPSALMADHEELIAGALQQMLEQMKQAPGAENTVKAEKILEAEMKILLSLCRQIEAVETELQPRDGNVNITKTIQPLAGSRLAVYCDAPAVNGFNPAVQSAMLPEGVLEVEFCMRNTDALTALIVGEAQALVESMGLVPALVDSWAETTTRWANAMESTVCESVFTGGGVPLEFSVLEDIRDKEAILEYLRTMEGDLESMGLFRMYKSMGMPMTIQFEESVREHAGVDIHRLKIGFEMTDLPPGQMEAMNALLGDRAFDLAICNDILAYTAGEGAVEKLIDQIQSGVVPAEQLAARSVYPAGGTCYVDFDVGGYFNFISTFVASIPEAASVFEKITVALQGAEPVVMAGYNNSGRMKVSTRIPADLMVRTAQAVQMMAMETMQKKSAMEAEQKASEPTDPAPEGTLKLLDGSSVELSSYAGQKVVVLDFWASWCGPCRKGLPKVQAVADHFAGRDVAFCAVNLREDAETVKGFVGEQGLTLPVALDDGALSEAFGVSGIPHTVVIGKDGTIKGTHTGLAPDLDAQLTAEINAALAESD